MKKLFLSDRTQLKLVAVTLLSFIMSKTQIETKVLRKLFLFFCKHLDTACHTRVFKLFLVAVSTQTNFVENCGRVLSLLFDGDIDSQSLMDDIYCDSCPPLTLVLKQGLADPAVLSKESFLGFVESYFSHVSNASPGILMGSIKDLIPVICTDAECSESWKRLVSYLATHFGFAFKEVLASLRKTNPEIVDLIESEVPSFASAYKKLAKIDNAKLTLLMKSESEKDKAKLENFRDGLKQTFLFEKSGIVLQLFKEFRSKLLPILGIDTVVDCFYQRSLKLISEELTAKTEERWHRVLLNAMKKYVDDELSSDKRMLLEVANELNVTMKCMVLERIYLYMGKESDVTKMTSSLSVNQIRDWLM